MVKCRYRKHTPIVSEAQRRLFGLWHSYPSKRPSSITDRVIMEHLREVRGKKLPERVR